MKKDNEENKKGKFPHFINSGDFFIFLGFFIIVFLYWYLANMGEEHEYEFTFVTSLRHVPEGMMITEAPAEKVVVKLRDRGEKILEYRARRSQRRLVIDHDDYTPVGGQVVICGEAFEQLLRNPFSSSTKILSVAPDTLCYVLASEQGRRLPVRVKGTPTAASGHTINRTALDPDSVTVWAPAVVLDTLSAVWTEPLTADALTDSTAFTLFLPAPQRGVQMEPAQVTFSVIATPFVEKTIELPIRPYLFPYGSELKTFPSKARVTFMVSMDQYRTVTDDQFELSVSYSSLDGSGKARPELTRQPACVKAVRIEPAEVDYLIERNGNL